MKTTTTTRKRRAAAGGALAGDPRAARREQAPGGNRHAADHDGSGARGRAPRRPGRRPGVTATLEALLEAATELFAERGYDGVPVWAIADRAGVNKAMISYHFGGKRQLYATIVGATFSEIVERVEALAAAPTPAPEALRE